MAAQTALVTLDASSAQRHRYADLLLLRDYWALTKPEINFLIVITTFAGFYLAYSGSSQNFPFLLLTKALAGTLLIASGAGTLNQYIERSFDSQMRRTSRRPLAAGRLGPRAVLRFGLTLSAAGSLYLAVAVNGLASLLALFTLLSYLLLYTPLKRRTPLCTLVGALPGAMPPLIGWAAATGRVTLEAWMLVAVIFLWQFPHFMAIAWMYREDYDRAGYLVLPDGVERARFAVLQTLLPLLGLITLTLLPAFTDQSHILYYAGASFLNLGFLYSGMQFALRRSPSSARRLLAVSIIYLPLLFGLMILRG